MAFCINCGSELTLDPLFCPNCGKSQGSSNASGQKDNLAIPPGVASPGKAQPSKIPVAQLVDIPQETLFDDVAITLEPEPPSGDAPSQQAKPLQGAFLQGPPRFSGPPPFLGLNCSWSSLRRLLSKVRLPWPSLLSS